MKKIFSFLMFCSFLLSAAAQPVYWVFLKDKSGSTFDPYSYFDSKAIERYLSCGADLYDVSNYPVSERYRQEVGERIIEEVGVSRWMNAVGVVATEAQVAEIEALPFVLRVQPLAGVDMTAASFENEDVPDIFSHAEGDSLLEAQLLRMNGHAFLDAGIDGKGIRIAVLDAGFPRVNTHNAFKHLRNENRIIKTWNFPLKKENVYGWNSHGTMTLSCIAGKIGDKALGLATGAEFLLARTEVNTEPFKEEVWWQMAMEWADRNGANIISSSLGYGKERYYTTDMDGRSYVAKAGNMAARKGILVCNSAGNEADLSQWRTIITPADADSVLCVGGIENSLDEYNHISFSSFGPSADGRLKPNVCAFGNARAAGVGSNSSFAYVQGTSFSCPLVAGFAACAWQASPGKKVMELFHMIEQSADLYPYYDYSFGYGVPQADFFCKKEQQVSMVEQRRLNPTFRIEEKDGEVKVYPTRLLTNVHVFYKEQNEKGYVERYAKRDIVVMDSLSYIAFRPKQGNRVVVNIGGYTDSSSLCGQAEDLNRVVFAKEKLFVPGSDETFQSRYTKNNLTVSDFGSCAKWGIEYALQLGLPLKTSALETPSLAWSPATRVAVRWRRAFSKSYSIGMGLQWGGTRYNYRGMQYNALEQGLGIPATEASLERSNYRYARVRELDLELFFRTRFVAGGLNSGGLRWELGIYGSRGFTAYRIKGPLPASVEAEKMSLKYNDVSALNAYRWNYGVSTRLKYDMFGVYARYRLNGLGSEPKNGEILMPRLEVGIELSF